MKKKSVGKNAVLNVFKTVLTLIFPLITFPYVSRILQVENLGRINFVNSIINYFILFATLGIKTYGTREGAAVREDKYKFQRFYSQVLTITIVSTIISYLILFLIVMFMPNLHSYTALFLILSISIILTTLGNEWVCSAYEDYFYITIRGILVQIISFVLIFTFIHDSTDSYKYALILVFSSTGANILNFIYIRKYVKHKLTLRPNFSVHTKPLLLLFASTLATSIYVSSDTTILGLICGDYYTGLYGASTKIYSVIKNLISAIVVVSIPRFSYYYINGLKKEYNNLLDNISKTMIILAIPVTVGVFMLSKEIILLLSGEQYIEATGSLKILSVAVIFVAASWILSQCILIPMKFEKYVLYTTIATAVLNIVLNLLLVSKWHQNAAAFTTLIAEAVVTIVYLFKVKKEIKIKNIGKISKDAIIGSMFIVLSIILIKNIINNYILCLIVSILVSIIIYFIVLLALKNEIVISYVRIINNKLKEKRI